MAKNMRRMARKSTLELFFCFPFVAFFLHFTGEAQIYFQSIFPILGLWLKRSAEAPGQGKCRKSASESAGPKRGAEESAEKSAPGSAPM